MKQKNTIPTDPLAIFFGLGNPPAGGIQKIMELNEHIWNMDEYGIWLISTSPLEQMVLFQFAIQLSGVPDQLHPSLEGVVAVHKVGLLFDLRGYITQRGDWKATTSLVGLNG